jgi:hypothetical protein
MIYCCIRNNNINTDFIVHSEASLSRRGNTTKKHSLTSRRILSFSRRKAVTVPKGISQTENLKFKREGAHCSLLILN